MNKKIKYAGILNEPMQGYRLATALLKSKDECINDHRKERQEREKALYEHYGLSYSPLANGHRLAMKMAADHIKGFSIESEKKAGRPAFWQGLEGAEFYFRVELKKRNKEISTRQAIRDVAKEMGVQGKIENLNARYHGELQKNKIVIIMEKIARGMALERGYTEIPAEMLEHLIKTMQEDPLNDSTYIP